MIKKLITDLDLFGDEIFPWTVCVITLILTYLSLRFLKFFLASRYKKYESQTNEKKESILFFFSLIQSTKNSFLLGLATYLGILFLPLTELQHHRLKVFFIFIFTLQLWIWGQNIIRFWYTHHLLKKALEDRSFATSVGFIHAFSQGILFVTLVLLGLSTMGINISALITGLGIGGVAVALSLQNILGDIFASISILIDKPFDVDDFIVVEGYSGRVKHIGLKTTRIQSVNGEQIIFSNLDLLKSRIRNYERMEKRRVLFTFELSILTQTEQIKKFQTLIQETIQTNSLFLFDYCYPINCTDQKIVFEIVYFILSSDFNTYAKEHSTLILTLLDGIHDLKIPLLATPKEYILTSTNPSPQKTSMTTNLPS